MAWYNSLRDLTGDIKKPVVSVGHALGSVASNPFVDAGLGAFLGPEAAAIAGGLGHLMAPGGNLGRGAMGALEGGAAGYAGQGLGNALRGASAGASAAGDVATPLYDQPGYGGVQQSVMQRVLGDAGSAVKGAGNFIKDNRATLETLGSGAQGIMSNAAENRKLNMQQQQTNAEDAQIQAAIDLQKNRAAAFAHLYGRPLQSGPSGPSYQSAPNIPSAQSAPRSPAQQAVMNRVMGASPNLTAPGGAQRLVTTDQPGGSPSPAGPVPQPQGPPGSPGSPGSPSAQQPPAAPGPTTPMPFPADSPYAGNDSLYGSPFGYGYANANQYFGRGY